MSRDPAVDLTNSSLQAGIGNLTICLIKDLTKSPESFFSLLDISITFLLFIIFLYESLWEIAFPTGSWYHLSATTRPKKNAATTRPKKNVVLGSPPLGGP